METRVRYAGEAEAPPLTALFGSVVGPLAIYSQQARDVELASHDAAQFAELIRRDAASVIIAETGGCFSGFAIVRDEHGPIWLDWYGVAETARGQGVGRAILAFVLSEARRRGATRVWCDTRTSNLASNALLEQLGFTRLCELTNHWYGQDYYLWDKSPL